MINPVPALAEVLSAWKLPQGMELLERLERMIRPALWEGHFGESTTRHGAPGTHPQWINR